MRLYLNNIAGYLKVVARLQSEGERAFGATINLGQSAEQPAQGWDLNTYPDFLTWADNGAVIDGDREEINAFIRSGRLFDGVADSMPPPWTRPPAT